ncbi:MAG: DUF4198 domain-containing protein [Cyclobacteriaceae bacterium]|nr:DUF4198 domain-containing protein [Cyclobacteriaceae bacterium]
MKKGIAILLVFVLIGLAQAHEFWMLPNKFRFEIGEKIILDFRVGEGFEGDHWDLNKHKVEKLSIHNRVGEIALTDKVETAKGKNLEYTFNNVGTHMIAMQSDAAFIEQSSEEFDAYLSEDGLDYIREEREKLGEQNSSAKELYTRYSKLLIQVGERADDTYKKSAGLKFEIIPLQNPYELKSGDYLDCKVVYRGNPVSGGLVKVWSHVGNRVFLQNIYTESDGMIRFPISSTGPWMVSSVKMVRSNSPKAEWESMWSSLVFEIE